jgi:hypothetical protein
LEIKSVYQDRHEHDREEREARARSEQNFRTIAEGIGSAIDQSQKQFEATTGHLEGILKSNAKMLAKENVALNQTMGGVGYPVFCPFFSSQAPSDKTLPVSGLYRSKDGLPLVDVSVEISVLPNKGTGIEGLTNEVMDTRIHPFHYNLGTIMPGIFEAPFQLKIGKRYQIKIVTRRNLFYENLYVDTTPTDLYKITSCTYQQEFKGTAKGMTLFNRIIEGDCKE